MDFLRVYSDAFNDATYSNDHHIQYDFALDEITKIISNKTDFFSLIDIGSGRGQLISSVKQTFINANITSVDVNKFNDIDVNFIKCDLSIEDNRNNLTCAKYDILSCTDVFEHLDKSFIEDVVRICSKLSSTVILAIANHSDIINNIELHTIQENDLWWDSQLIKYFDIEQKQIHYDGRLYMYVCKTKV